MSGSNGSSRIRKNGSKSPKRNEGKGKEVSQIHPRGEVGLRPERVRAFLKMEREQGSHSD